MSLCTSAGQVPIRESRPWSLLHLHWPASQPASQPTNQPTSQPTSQPANQPANQPARQAGKQASRQAVKQSSSQAVKQASRPASQPILLVRALESRPTRLTLALLRQPDRAAGAHVRHVHGPRQAEFYYFFVSDSDWIRAS